MVQQHPARPFISLDLRLTLDEADALAAALAQAGLQQPRAVQRIHSRLRSALRLVEWTHFTDTPKNFATLRGLLNRAVRSTYEGSAGRHNGITPVVV